MERNRSPDRVPDDNAPKVVIPTIHISTAIKVVASDLGGERQLKTVTTIIETSDPDIPSVAAIEHLGEEYPGSEEYILALAEEMHDDERRWRNSRRFARREERPEWRRNFGKAILKYGQYSIYGAGMVIPPEMFK